jgi:cytochrome b561
LTGWVSGEIHAVELVVAIAAISNADLRDSRRIRIQRAMTDDPTSTARYSRTAIALHWAIAALVLSTIPLGLFGASSESAAAQSATNTHKAIGVLILLLTLVRVGWRLSHKPPALPASMSLMMRRIATATHILFYCLLLILPLSGWWMSSAVPDRHSFGFGIFDVPFLPVPRGWASAGPAHFVHTILAFVMIGLAVLHILAALKHHFVGKDDILLRMLPLRK